MRDASDLLRIPRAADVVADHLRRQIVRGEIPEGRHLPPEGDLRSRFGVSGPTLRAAYRILESEGLVTVHRGARGGASVHRPSIGVASRYVGVLLQAEGTTVADLFEARAMLEPGLARAVATRSTADIVAELRAGLAEEERTLDDPAAFATATTSFHATLVRRAGNHTMAVMLQVLWDLFEQHTFTAMVVPPGADGRSRRAAVTAHTKLTALIEAGDEDGAEAFWRTHMRAVAGLFVSRYGASALYEVLV